jgi:sensor histidine kinase regulating citrate/malate metabolism
MRITNPVAEKVEITNNTAATTKKDRLSHGFGLYNIKKTVEKYKGDFSIKSDSSVFILELGFQLSAISQT